MGSLQTFAFSTYRNTLLVERKSTEIKGTYIKRKTITHMVFLFFFFFLYSIVITNGMFRINNLEK